MSYNSCNRALNLKSVSRYALSLFEITRPIYPKIVLRSILLPLHITQVNSAFGARRLASSKLSSQALFTSEHRTACETLKNRQFMTACGSGWIENQKGIALWKNKLGNKVYHENRPHSSSTFESFSGSPLISIASKNSSVGLTFKVCFISPQKLLFGCIFGPPLNSQAICPVLRNIGGYALTHSSPWHSGESLPRRAFATIIDHFSLICYRYGSFWRYLLNLCGICRWIVGAIYLAASRKGKYPPLLYSWRFCHYSAPIHGLVHVTWPLIMKLFPAKCHERATLRKLWRQMGNSSLLPVKFNWILLL